MASKAPVILYHYDASPMANKAKSLLLLKKIPHKRVAVSMTQPRPELNNLLGVTYRRIPILAIGNDVYCDTALIATALERRFPPSQGYPTLFPARKGGGRADTGLAKATATYWGDRVVFNLIAQSLPYKRFDAKFMEDRAQWMGGKIDVEGLAATQDARNSAIASHLTLLEEQLADGREWLLDTEAPGLVDIAVHTLLSWGLQFKVIKPIISTTEFQRTHAWLARVNKHLADLSKADAAAVENISSEEGAKLITSSSHEDIAAIGFHAENAKSLGLNLGDTVAVTPTDNGKVPTIGRLLALNREESVIEAKGTAGVVRCHFPRLDFSVKLANAAKL